MIPPATFRIATRCATCLLTLLVCGSSFGQVVSLTELLSRAASHPEVGIASADVDVAVGGVVAADRAPLPTISAGVASIDLQNGLGPGSLVNGKRLDKGIGVDWVWERGDKRLHRTRSAELTLEASRLDRFAMLLERKILIAGAFWDLRAAQDRESDSALMVRSAEQIADVARKRLERGDISEQEAARVLIEVERALSDDAAVRAARRIAAISLAQAAGIPTDTFEAEPGWPSFTSELVPVSTATLTAGSELLRQIDQLSAMRPDVRAARARLEAARSALVLARALQVPDITWGGGINNHPPDQRASVQVRAQFPWQLNYKFEGEIRQAVAALQRSEEALRNTQLAAQSELTSLALRKLASVQRLASIEARILTRSQEVLDRAEAAYARGAMPLTDLLDARRTFRAVRLDAVQTRLEAARADTEWQLRTALPTP